MCGGHHKTLPMSSLTETAYYTRRTINWTILGVIGYIILRLFWGILVSVYITVFPPKAPPPNYAFGTLPALKFPVGAASPSGQLVYQLQTIEGSVPETSPSAHVYFMPKTGSNLLALSTAQSFAKRLGFDTNPISDPSDNNIYRFDDPEAPLRHLWYDVVSSNFVIRYDFQQDAGLFLNNNVPTAQQAQAEAKTILQTYNLFPADYAGGNVTVTYYRVNQNALVTVPSQSQADAVRVDFYRPYIASTPVVTGVSGGPISITLSGSPNSKKRILQFSYTYWPVDYQTNATYKLKTSTQAWQELQSGAAYVIKYPGNNQVIMVRNVYLAYYDSLDPETYLQPVFVFEGDGGFMAYVPAISPEYVDPGR